MTAEKLTRPGSVQTSKLINEPERPFRIAISEKLKNGYGFKDLNPSALKTFHSFLEETVYKGLTVSQMDRMYLRKEGLSDAPKVFSDTDREMIHYGKDRKPFRIFGYYDMSGYFVLCRIDPGHKTNKQ